MISLLASATLAAASPTTPASPMPMAGMNHSAMAGMDHAKMAKSKPMDCCKKGCCADKAAKPAEPAHAH